MPSSQFPITIDQTQNKHTIDDALLLLKELFFPFSVMMSQWTCHVPSPASFHSADAVAFFCARCVLYIYSNVCSERTQQQKKAHVQVPFFYHCSIWKCFTNFMTFNAPTNTKIMTLFAFFFLGCGCVFFFNCFWHLVTGRLKMLEIFSFVYEESYLLSRMFL